MILQAKRTFNIDFADLHSMFKDNQYDWLPGPNEIPKELGKQLGQEYLDELEVRSTDTLLDFFSLPDSSVIYFHVVDRDKCKLYIIVTARPLLVLAARHGSDRCVRVHAEVCSGSRADSLGSRRSSA